jgi:hypothetical protein
MAALSEYSDLPDPPQMTQSAAFRSSYNGIRLCRLMPRMLSLILLTYPIQLILLFMSTAPYPQTRDFETLYIILVLAELEKYDDSLVERSLSTNIASFMRFRRAMESLPVAAAGILLYLRQLKEACIRRPKRRIDR